MKQLLDDIERLVTPVLTENNAELVDLTYQKSHGGWTLSFYLDKAGGITLDDCTDLSHKLGAVLDQANVIDRAYVLEVASPGVDRPLRKTKDFETYAGERVHVKLLEPINGQRNFHGILLGADETSIRIRTDEKIEVALPRTHVVKCRLNPVIKI